MSTARWVKTDRRDFLRMAGISAAATAAVAVPATQTARADADTTDKKLAGRYSAESPHVRAFYRVNRYPMK